MTRTRDGTDVDEALDVIGLQHRHKRLDRQCGVPESEEGAVRPMRFLRWRMFAHDGCSERAGCRINTIGLPASTYPLHSACADSAVGFAFGTALPTSTRPGRSPGAGKRH